MISLKSQANTSSFHSSLPGFKRATQDPRDLLFAISYLFLLSNIDMDDDLKSITKNSSKYEHLITNDSYNLKS